MPSITAALSINNGAASPVAKTFSIAEKNPAQSLFEERTTGIQSQFTLLRIRGQKPSGARKSSRVEFKVALPVIRAVDGVNVAIDSAVALCSFTMPEGMTIDERKDLLAFLSNSLSHADLKKTVQDLDFIY